MGAWCEPPVEDRGLSLDRRWPPRDLRGIVRAMDAVASPRSCPLAPRIERGSPRGASVLRCSPSACCSSRVALPARFTLPLDAVPLLSLLAVATVIVVAAASRGGTSTAASPIASDAIRLGGNSRAVGCCASAVHRRASQPGRGLLWLPLVADHLSRIRFLASAAPSRSAEMPTALRSADFESAVLGCSRPFEEANMTTTSSCRS